MKIVFNFFESQFFNINNKTRITSTFIIDILYKNENQKKTSNDLLKIKLCK